MIFPGDEARGQLDPSAELGQCGGGAWVGHESRGLLDEPGMDEMIAGFAILLMLQLAGEVTARGLGLPVPGPVLGMAFLVVGLAIRERTGAPDPVAGDAPRGRVADGLLGSLAILFVPAGVGVVQYLDLIAAQGAAIVVTLVASTMITLLATVATFRLIKRATGRGAEGEETP